MKFLGYKQLLSNVSSHSESFQNLYIEIAIHAEMNRYF